MANTSKDTTQQHWLRAAFVAALPIVAGYIVLGIPCGILGVQAKMNTVQIVCMSLLFYSGAGQYMIANMWIAGTPILSIIASVSLVNSRQVLYAASTSRFMGSAGKRASLLFAATLTDESFGVNLERFAKSEARKSIGQDAGTVPLSCALQQDAGTVPVSCALQQDTGTVPASWTVRQATAVNICSLLTWVLANTAGAILGSLLFVPVALASFAMTSIFICLLFMQRFKHKAVVAAGVSAFVVLVMKLAGWADPAIFLGAVAGIVVAMLLPADKSESPGVPKEQKSMFRAKPGINK